jgi:SAM-dependent methyltransferase
MSAWSEGYVAEIEYTHGYYAELNPLRAQLALAGVGLVAPAMSNACELGYGQGLSANLHAAGSQVQWWGTDFNPSQADFAQQLAGPAASRRAHLFDQGFEQFCVRDDLPEFDYIGLHGIWSWISDANRAAILKLIDRKLKVGGVLYVSYNTMPGWAAFGPVQHLMSQYSARMSVPGHGVVQRVEQAVGFVEKLFATNPIYVRANPMVADRLKKIAGMNKSYLAHEYFNQHWVPMPFAEAARWFESAKLTYACSAHLLDLVDPLNLTAEQQKLLAEIPDPGFRQTVRDYIVNQQFRRDYWVKGPRRMAPLEQVEALRRCRVVLTTPRAECKLKTAAPIGEANLQESIYNPILDALASHQPKTLAQIEQAVQDKGIGMAAIAQAMMVLVGMGQVNVAQDEAVVAKSRKASDQINQRLMTMARTSPTVNFLSSPVVGGGVTANRIQQLYVFAYGNGVKAPGEMAALVWKLLAQQNQCLVKDGKAIEGAEANLAELNQQAKDFIDKQMPIYKALGVM